MKFNFSAKIDRKHIEYGPADELEKKDKIYWQNASYEEKFITITYLRECFYGPKATTGRLQRFYSIVKQK